MCSKYVEAELCSKYVEVGGVLKYGCVLLLGLFAGHRSKFVGVVCEYVC